VLIKLNKKGDRREFQIGSFGGVTGGKSGVKQDKEVAFTAEHVGVRTYRVTIRTDLKPGEYAFFMGGPIFDDVGSHGGKPVWRSRRRPRLRFQHPGVRARDSETHTKYLCFFFASC
jgi:hypothetical protein